MNTEFTEWLKKRTFSWHHNNGWLIVNKSYNRLIHFTWAEILRENERRIYRVAK